MQIGSFFRGSSGTLLRAALATGALLLALAVFAYLVHRHYPIEEWLFWHYASYWVAGAVWFLACTAAGSLVVDRVIRARLPVVEHGLFAFTFGLLAFEWALFLIGAAQAYRTPAFFLLPVVFLAAGFESLRDFGRRIRSVLARARPNRSALRVVAVGFGLIGLLMVYFLILTPENVQFDSRWKHMALAEDYVAHGGIRRSTEGWIFAARPHITSYLYAWAFLIPSDRLFDKVLFAAHLEFFTFLVTTVLGVSALVRRLVPGADPSAVWAARFLFPGVLLYDSSLSGGADHFGALYAAPIAIATLRAVHGLSARWVGALAALLAGTVMVKETAALMLVPFPIAAVAVVWAVQVVKTRKSADRRAALGRLARVALVALGVGLAVSAPLWLKNLVLYGDPLYPQLSRWFPADPWSEAAALKMKYSYSERQMWAPSRDAEGLLQTVRALFSFSFEPHNWSRLHGKVPVFGSLFTLLLVVLPLLSKTRRIWFVAAFVHVGIFAWYSVHHQDRYLQAVVPLMAACVAATLVLLFRAFGPVVRVAAAALVGFQIVWGGDVYFFQTHAMVKSPIKAANDLLSAGYEKNYEGRFKAYPKFEKLGEALPKRARVLFHEQHPHLGVGAESVLDSYQWQFGIDYGKQGTPEGVRRHLRDHGVTHVYYTPGRANSATSVASDILFHEFVERHAANSRRVSGGTLVEVPSTPSNVPFRDRVVAFGCREKPVTGVYTIQALDLLPYGPNWDVYPPPERAGGDVDAALAALSEVDWALVDTRCFKKGRWPDLLVGPFDLAVKRKNDSRELWRRAAPEATPAAPPEPPDDASSDPTEN